MTALAHRQPPPSVQEAALARSSGQSLARLIVSDAPRPFGFSLPLPASSTRA